MVSRSFAQLAKSLLLYLILARFHYTVPHSRCVCDCIYLLVHPYVNALEVVVQPRPPVLVASTYPS